MKKLLEMEMEKRNKRKRKLGFETEWRYSKQMKMIEIVLYERGYIVKRGEACGNLTTAVYWGIKRLCFFMEA